MWVSAFFPGAGLRAKRKGMVLSHALHPLQRRYAARSSASRIVVVLNERAGRVPYAITTPEHGTAFDIAGKGIAKTKATEEAIRIAAQMSAPKA